MFTGLSCAYFEMHVVEVVEFKMSIVEPVNRFIINLEDDSSRSDTE